MKKEFKCVECGKMVVVDRDEALKIEEVMIEEEMCYSCTTEIYAYCEECDELTHKENMEYVFIVDTDEWLHVCKDCLDDLNAFWCEEHDRYEVDGDSVYVNEIGYICSEAWYWGDYYRCPSCGERYHIDDGWWDDDNEEYYCRDCYEDVVENRVIKRYHYHTDDYEYEKRTTREDRENTKPDERMFYGIELETEEIGCGRYTNQGMASELMKITDDFVYENDGSLECGFEIISLPFTADYMKNELQFDILKMLETLKVGKFGATERCGLHFHMTKVNWESTLQMACLMEYYQGELRKISKRESKKIDRWCDFYTHGLGKSEICRLGVNRIENIIEDNNSRYRALNIRNHNTIEVRIFSATNDYNELMARWELVHNFYKWAREHKLEDDFYNIPSFYKLATYDENNFIGSYLQNNFAELCDKEKATF